MVAGSHALATKFLTLTGLGGEHIIILCVYPEPVSQCSLIINTSQVRLKTQGAAMYDVSSKPRDDG